MDPIVKALEALPNVVGYAGLDAGPASVPRSFIVSANVFYGITRRKLKSLKLNTIPA